MRRRSFGRANWIALLAVLGAFGLRLYSLDAQSFAFDEGWTSYAISYPWQELWAVLAPDNHPPLYYVGIKAFADLAGYTDFPIRFFSVACGTALVALLYALGSRLAGRVAGLSAALLSACLPSFIYYAQEARMYSLLMALAAAGSLYSSVYLTRPALPFLSRSRRFAETRRGALPHLPRRASVWRTPHEQ